MTETLEPLDFPSPDNVAGVVDAAPESLADDEALVVADAAAEPADPQAVLTASPDGGVPVAADRPREADTVATESSPGGNSSASLPALNVHAAPRTATADPDIEDTRGGADGEIATRPAREPVEAVTADNDRSLHGPDESPRVPVPGKPSRPAAPTMARADRGTPISQLSQPGTRGMAAAGSDSDVPPGRRPSPADMPGRGRLKVSSRPPGTPSAAGAGGKGDGSDLPPVNQGHPVDEPDEPPKTMQQLATDAKAEAASLRILPSDWEEGREQLSGFSMDAKDARSHEDVIGLDAPGGVKRLTVSLPDAGFLEPATAMRANAEHVALTHGPRSMLPERVANQVLSLNQRESTPVISWPFLIGDRSVDASDPFLGVQRPLQLTPEEADRILASDAVDPVSEELRELYQAARRLIAQRLGGPGALYQAELGLIINASGQVIPTPASPSPGWYIINESLLQTNIRAAQFTQEHRIPAIYYNQRLGHVALGAELEALQSGNPQEREAALIRLQASFGRTAFSTTPVGHEGIGVDAYMRLKPLRLLDGLINIMNLSAFLGDRPYPYPADEVSAIAQKLNTAAARFQGRKTAAIPMRKDDSARTTYYIQQIQSSVPPDTQAESPVVTTGPEQSIVGFAAALTHTLETGQLTTPNTAILLHNMLSSPASKTPEVQSIAGAFISYFRANPDTMYAVLNHLQSTDIIITNITVNPQAAEELSASATLAVKDGIAVQVEIVGALSRKQVREAATLHLITAALGIIPSGVTIALEPDPSELPDINIGQAGQPVRWALDALNNYASTRGIRLPPPTFEPPGATGPYTATIRSPQGEIIGTGEGNSHRTAREAAAQDGLLHIDRLYEATPERFRERFLLEMGVAAMTELHESRAVLGLSDAHYTTTQREQGGYICQITDNEGNIVGRGLGRSSELAQIAAARNGLQHFKANLALTPEVLHPMPSPRSSLTGNAAPRNQLIDDRRILLDLGPPDYHTELRATGLFRCQIINELGTILGTGYGRNIADAEYYASADALSHSAERDISPDDAAQFREQHED